MGFAQTELEAIAKAVSAKVLADLTPQLEDVADRIAKAVITRVEAAIEAKLS